VADVFDEVEEQLRSERYKTIALKSLPWVGALALIAILVTGGFWGWQTYQDKAAAKASEQYAQALKSFDEGKTEQAVAAWTDVAVQGLQVHGPDAVGRGEAHRQQDRRCGEVLR
jgi:hypothetical protein